MHDYQAWKRYPNHRNWFNKLWVSEKLQYRCGPCGVAPDISAYYIVRPIYNLSGMGVGAKKVWIEANDYSQVPPGYFWCEFFEGNQYSATFVFQHDKNPWWKQLSCWMGVKSEDNLSQFQSWHRSDKQLTVPRIFNDLSGIEKINIEFIGDNPIEVHLRESPDPNCEEFIPIWSGEENMVDKYEKLGYTYIKSYEDADGFLKTPRLGFMIKGE